LGEDSSAVGGRRGELTIESLDLTATGSARYYEAPFQLKATAVCYWWMTSGASAARHTSY